MRGSGLCLLLGLATNLRAADLLVRVLEDHSDRPLASVQLRIQRVGTTQLIAHLETGTDGRIFATNLPTGEYRIEASKPNYVGTTVRVDALSGGTMTIRMVRCGVISGRVLDGAGEPVRGSAVYAMATAASGGMRPFSIPGVGTVVWTNDRGEYRVHSLPPGDFLIVASYGASPSIFGSTGGGAAIHGLGSGVQFYPTNSRPLVFTLTGGEDFRNMDFAISPTTLLSVSGRVELPEPKASFWLALIDTDRPSLATAVAATKADGTFRFEGVPPGTYILTAAGPTQGYGGAAILKPDPFYGRTEITLGSVDVEGINITVKKGRTLSFILAPTSGPPEGCPATAQLTLMSVEDFAARLERTSSISFHSEQKVDQIAPARFKLTLGNLGETCFQPRAAFLDASTWDGGPVRVAVSSAGAIRGTLTGAGRISDLLVALVATDILDGVEPIRVAFTSRDGRFLFHGIRPGRYRIAVRASEGSQSRWIRDKTRMVEIHIEGGTPTEVELPAAIALQEQ